MKATAGRSIWDFEIAIFDFQQQRKKGKKSDTDSLKIFVLNTFFSSYTFASRSLQDVHMRYIYTCIYTYMYV